MGGKRIATGAGICVGAALAAPATAQANDFAVTNLSNSGAGSLREAIEDANATSAEDRIVFNSKLSGTINLSSVLEISESVEIVGPGARKVTMRGPTGGGEDALTGDSFQYLTISDLTIVGDDDGLSFDVLNELNLSDSTVSGVAEDGAGIDIELVNLFVEDSTITDSGTGIEGFESYMNIQNSTITDNDYGGLDVVYGEQLVRSTTIALNGAAGPAGGGIVSYGADVRLVGSLIGDNVNADLGITGGAADFDAAFSLIERPGKTGVTSAGGNLIGVTPLLKPLANNGGPTDTVALKKESQAINKGPAVEAAGTTTAPAKDQRGVPRKGKADIGAYEFVKCKGVVVNRVGTAGKDRLRGTRRRDGILGLAGNDKLIGRKGKDGLCGGRGKDKLKGGPGKDKLNGGPGKDKEIQ
jgi:hypothetical protein